MADAALIDIVKRQGLRRLDQPIELASGAMSSDFVDVKVALCRWADLQVACRAIVQQVQQAGIEFDAAGGMTMGADSLAVGIAAETDGQWFSVRKEPKKRGTKQQIEGTSLGPGHRVLLLEDATTTGGSTERAYEVIRDTGAEVVAVATVIDRGDTARRRFEALGLPYFPALTYTDLGIEPVVPPG
ncbi:MAG: phosphoribosyltransferase family protein [bacterium]|nr:phosphoribosyltransferase family protein [bacterium]MCY3889280.1 phosphoribosyltransferase family protein [bacterium]MCY3961585.1 phosphoribosyltransferase family protein [bacterium]MCY4133349.1 phosphoribosyltransferase family protein [bacterium]